MAARGAAILKRLALLNRSGALARPLPYSQVKEPLLSVSEEVALQILQNLESEAQSVLDPIEYVKSAVAATTSSAGDKQMASAADAAFQGIERKRKTPPLPEPGAAEGPVAKRLRMLNGSSQLLAPIDCEVVQEALGSLGVAQAMTILRGLQDAAAEVSDPTGYIRTAVRSAGGLMPQDETEEMGDPFDEQAPSTEAPTQPPPWAAVKAEPYLRPKGGDDLSDSEKIERRVVWLNRNGKLVRPMELAEVLPALDSIGLRQSMRVLRRLEEAASTVADPDEFVKDLVARSGWIWSKPDVIDDDEKVAKRVSWLNQFGGLSQPIDYAAVADILDGLKVAHAMVLLRELEVQAHRIDSPTEYIRKTASLAGEDDVHIPLVDQSSSIAQRVTQLNDGGVLAKPINFKEVGEDLGRLGDEQAMQLLQEVELKGKSVKDPTGFLKFKLKAKLATLSGTTLQDEADDDTKILKRVEWLNDYGGLLQDIDYNKVAPRLASAGLEGAMAVLKELEDRRKSVDDPTAFLLANIKAAPGGPAKRGGQAARPAVASGGQSGASDLNSLTEMIGFLNKHSKLKRPVKFSDIASAMDTLGPAKAMKVLQTMQERGLGLDDPVAYIKAAALRAGPQGAEEDAEDEVDDVAKITKRLKWLNQFGGLSRKVKVDEVVGALYCLGLRQSMTILRGLQDKGSGIADPTWYIKAAVQRANGVRVTPPEPAEEPDAAAEEAEEPEEADEEDLAAAHYRQVAATEGEGLLDFEDPEGESDAEAAAGQPDDDDPWADFEAEAEPDPYFGADAAEDAAEQDTAESGLLRPKAEQFEDAAPRTAGGSVRRQTPAGLAAKVESKERRVVGGLTGAVGKLTPARANWGMVKAEHADEPEVLQADDTPVASSSSAYSSLPITPQEKLIQVREYALKHGLDLDQNCLKGLSRLAFYKAKDMVDDVLLGGKNRRGVTNPSRYLTIGCQKMVTGLGAEQGLAMELAVSIGVVLNNDALDELACIPRKDSHAIIRELSKNEEARQDPMRFIMSEVMKCRAKMDARPWPPPAK